MSVGSLLYNFIHLLSATSILLKEVTRPVHCEYKKYIAIITVFMTLCHKVTGIRLFFAPEQLCLADVICPKREWEKNK